jgi:G3E family GTPase
MQVAETFAMGAYETGEDGKGKIAIAESVDKSLSSIAKLDTCVTVLDVANFMNVFEDIRFDSDFAVFDSIDDAISERFLRRPTARRLKETIATLWTSWSIKLNLPT